MDLLNVHTSLGLHIQGQGTSDAELVVRDDGFGGWDDGTSMRAETLARPQAHGDFDMPGFLAGRLMPLKGWAFGDTAFDIEELRDRFIGHGAGGTKFRVSVERNGRTLHADARVASGTLPTFRERPGRGVAEWACSWWFPDPRKYGKLRTFGPASSVQVMHRGNFAALPVLTVTGTSAGGYTITGPGGRVIVISRALAAGSPHKFDMRTGRLWVGSTRVLSGIARADLFTIPPGMPATTVSVSAGSLQVKVEDTFI